jgi:adenosylcobinamide-GDP ribazoletransferase
MKQQLEYFFAALRFFTRLPVPAWVGHSQEQLNHAARYFPLVGILVGAIGAAVTELAVLALPIGVAVLLGMAATVLVTGGFHEDGFADACDGFGGGWDKAQVLAIMKDSRIGSYAAIGLGLLLLTKWTALVEIDAAFGPPVWPGPGRRPRRVAPGLDRADPFPRLRARRRQQQIQAAGAAHGAGRAGHRRALRPGALPAAAPGRHAGRPGARRHWSAFAARYFLRRIGGYTGDCLGATQQLAELAFYLGMLCNFS